MKKVIIFHGTEFTPDDFWYQAVGNELRARGYEVEIPHYPEMNREPIETFLPKVLAAHQIGEDIVLIGHSAGATLILSIAEHIPFKQGVLVAGFCEPLAGADKDVILQDKYDWEKMRKNCNDFVFINSVNDPWGCDDKQGRAMFDQLGGTQIIRTDGHFGSRGSKQEYPTFELLNRLVA